MRGWANGFWAEQARPWPIALAVILLLYPAVASDFFTFQIGAYSLLLGTVALSLMMLAGYGGMVSLAQMTVAGFAGYMMAIFGTNSVDVHGLGWPWWVLIPSVILASAVFSALIGAIAVRTEGIYTIMITLAIAVAFFYFTRQNYALFNGFTGFAGVASSQGRAENSDTMAQCASARRRFGSVLMISNQGPRSNHSARAASTPRLRAVLRARS